MDDRDVIELDRVDIYSNHLYLADFGRRFAARLRSEAACEASVVEASYLEGYAQAVADISAHLEEGEGLPGGPVYHGVSSGLGGR